MQRKRFFRWNRLLFAAISVSFLSLGIKGSVCAVSLAQTAQTKMTPASVQTLPTEGFVSGSAIGRGDGQWYVKNSQVQYDLYNSRQLR